MNGPDLEPLPIHGQVTTRQISMLDPSPALRFDEPSSMGIVGDAQEISTVPKAPPTKLRKRKALTLRATDWEPYKTQIVELHITQTYRSQKLRQYRSRISQWGLDKNIKPKEMKAIVRKRQQRKLVEDHSRELSFTVRGYNVEPEKIDRWMKRNDVP
ncbi:hypothetical protein K469DRAFT_682227 [Zopfia rhizophila CBS 207.26]|uniref:Clr5 domain-containing protein n=1 Tax=Zopfia rhizophila CBS 207.26 TaxID=1314779 RepID=A0A6A6EDI3_9PEZI|nr:hypothetical protein K469DRAFT_682227 [Zopfia rhizophila CBS 207.26]